MTRLVRSAAVLFLLSAPAMLPPHVAAQQPPRPIELDAATIASRTEAARSLIPLLEDVKEKAEARYEVGKGSVPDSPFTGTQTTAVAITIGKKNNPPDPEVVRAMERLLQWEPGNRADAEQAALFDAWLAALSSRASSMATKRGLVSCDTGCVVEMMTQLDDRWGADKQRSDDRDQVLLDAFVEAVKQRK